MYEAISKRGKMVFQLIGKINILERHQLRVHVFSKYQIHTEQ